MARSFKCSTDFEWIAEKDGELNFEEKETIPVSVPPEFGGDGNKVNPEELLNGAINTCFGLTFFGYLSRSGAEVEEFKVHSEGHYGKGKSGLEFTEFVLHAKVGISAEQDEAELQSLLEKGETECLITKSLDVPVKLETEIYRV